MVGEHLSGGPRRRLNAFYSYSFAQRTDWPKHFSAQQILLDYFRACADEHGIREHIRFQTEVLSADFDEVDATWTLRLPRAGWRERR